jgi:hypothetical protein
VRLALQQPLPARAVGDEQPHGVRRHPVNRWIPRPGAAPPRSLLVLGLRHRPQVHRERGREMGGGRGGHCNCGKGNGGSPREAAFYAASCFPSRSLARR